MMEKAGLSLNPPSRRVAVLDFLLARFFIFKDILRFIQHLGLPLREMLHVSVMPDVLTY